MKFLALAARTVGAQHQMHLMWGVTQCDDLLEQDRKEHDSCLVAWELGSFAWHHSVRTMPNAGMQQTSKHSSAGGGKYDCIREATFSPKLQGGLGGGGVSPSLWSGVVKSCVCSFHASPPSIFHSSCIKKELYKAK